MKSIGKGDNRGEDRGEDRGSKQGQGWGNGLGFLLKRIQFDLWIDRNLLSRNPNPGAGATEI